MLMSASTCINFALTPATEDNKLASCGYHVSKQCSMVADTSE